LSHSLGQSLASQIEASDLGKPPKAAKVDEEILENIGLLTQIKSGWWFGTFGLFFHILGISIHPD
jgi:hypothetical protein